MHVLCTPAYAPHRVVVEPALGRRQPQCQLRVLQGCSGGSKAGVSNKIVKGVKKVGGFSQSKANPNSESKKRIQKANPKSESKKANPKSSSKSKLQKASNANPGLTNASRATQNHFLVGICGGKQKNKNENETKRNKTKKNAQAGYHYQPARRDWVAWRRCG